MPFTNQRRLFLLALEHGTTPHILQLHQHAKITRSRLLKVFQTLFVPIRRRHDYMIHEINIRFYPLFFPPVNHQTFFFLFFPNLVSSPLKNLRRSHSDFSWHYLSRFSPRAYRSAYTYKFSLFAIISFLVYLRGGWLVDSLIGWSVGGGLVCGICFA